MQLQKLNLYSFLCFVSLLLVACGDAENSNGNATGGGDGSEAPVDEITLPTECTVEDINDAFDTNCETARVTFGGDVIVDSIEDNNEITMIASKKNGGSGGSKWFSARITLSGPLTILLPTQIPAAGKAGNGQKLYVNFNDTVDCAWYSHANNKYRNPRCFTGAARNGGTSSGFSGGTEVANDRVESVTEMHMQVAGASGSGILTTATGTFEIEP